VSPEEAIMMKKPTWVMFICVAAALFAAVAVAADGVKGRTVRPLQEKAKVAGCKIAKPGSYEVAVEDLIELDYTYPVVPTAIPNKVDHKQPASGSVVKSELGFRTVSTPRLLGTGTIAFYFEAKKEGEDKITVIIDENEYEYTFKVVKR
jgi:hypothetical protein